VTPPNLVPVGRRFIWAVTIWVILGRKNRKLAKSEEEFRELHEKILQLKIESTRNTTTQTKRATAESPDQ
jgi:hypothetical protein